MTFPSLSSADAAGPLNAGGAGAYIRRQSLRPVRRAPKGLMTMIRLPVLAAAVAATLGLSLNAAAAQPAAPATGRAVVLTNATGHTMIQFFASSVERHDWQDDRLGPVLADGESRRVPLNRAGEGCRFDFRAVLDDGRALERRGVNICETPAYTFTG